MGLVPSWLKDTRGKSRPINARCETVSEKPFFRGPWRHHRCLLPADGFYGWRPTPEGERAMAPMGRNSLTGSTVRTAPPSGWAASGTTGSLPMAANSRPAASSLTPPNALPLPIHDRMPVVILDGWEEA
ncbi:SOS response-associated peptidase family protein [Cyanobium gracile]|uniref:SOS response-associated peptidase family protein n=1 Tax=Cyanobium gracile TaxID=59930 RepID=UPI003A4C531F